MLLPMNFKKLISIRSRTAYKVILSFLPIPQVPPKPELELTFLTMCGSNYLQFLQQCLFSLYNSWSSLPKIQIVSDGTLTLSNLEKALTWWPGTKSFSSWEQSVFYHRQKGCESLAQFAENSVIGRKLAVILEFGERSATLWCDTDILWFKELPGLPLADRDSSLPILKVSEDYQQSYDKNLVEQGFTHLYNPPFINTGLVFLHGNLIQECNLTDLLDLAAKKSNHHTEQTILAEAAYQLGKSTWSPEEITCSEEGKFSLIPNYTRKQWAAKHYAGPTRHLFWRDALALRLLSFHK